ncbi:MAG: C-GCAxxG-C-C family protein [Planctomycetota bacterium]
MNTATTKFLDGYNCAQSVLFAHCEELGLDEDLALKMACGFGAGMGRAQEVCGAASGGVLVLGLRHGRGSNDAPTATETTYAKTREFLTKFKAACGGLTCRELLKGCDLLTPEGHQQFKDNDLRRKICVPCVEAAVKILEEMK